MDTDLTTLAKRLGKEHPVILLESQSGEHPWSQYTYLASQPKAAIKVYGNKVYIREDGEEYMRRGNPWSMLQSFRDRHQGWLFGYLGYDLKNHTEELSSQNTDPIGASDLYFMVPKVIIEQDRKSQKMNVIKGTLRGSLKCDHTEGEQTFQIAELQHQTSRHEYLERIHTAQQLIRDGGSYEINLSHQLKSDFRGSAWALYQKMKAIGPVPFGAFLQMDEATVCCQSPERFLRKEGSTIFTQPIKGTSPRGKNEAEDQVLKEQLAASAKERAENLMIVDLVRNDLSRIGQTGSVKVDNLFNIETFSTVHQMVSTVQAEARENNPIQTLKACFPMGSMTGAPKISAMQSIEALERYKRGIYSGAIGYIKPDGDFDFNVVIRTAIIKNDELFYSVGGAITGDSDPQDEWDETMVKARALLETLDEENKTDIQI